MSSTAAPVRVTLPSINELFPEHLMLHPSAINRHSPPMTSPATRVRDEFTPRPTLEYPAPGRPPPPASPSCSFDVLRPHPLTAHLENVASSTNAAVQPRVPATGAYAFTVPSSSDAYLASITKARPTFKVQLTQPSSSSPPAYEYAPSTAYGSQDAQQSAPAFTPSFSANTYLSAPTTAGSAQSLQRLAQQQLPPAIAQAADEKRHRCPHCSKRFNRPSSLNIHVNTHTGAKPFVCRFPGCNRKFNVNSNMRRHYRNHLAARRRDVVARHMQPTSPSPSFSHSSPGAHSPDHSYLHTLPPPTSSYGSQSRSPSQSLHSGYSSSDYESDDPGMSYVRGFKVESSPAHEMHGQQHGYTVDRSRLRSRSSPAPRSPMQHYPYPPSHVPRLRASSSATACNVPGCGCSTISTALRPAFPESMAPVQRPTAAERS
ncbi:hypothetical protein B0H21DRAFT_155793 [Amylocystis lapponica]|nr:hypothetical protein B0H21DRAFT_155793 [Amylocystis lapponica]